MSAEQLIALEAAQQQLGTLYTVARTFAPLAARAEGELLPCLLALGNRLRRLLRSARLTAAQIEAAAREIQHLQEIWHAELERVHTSAVYQQAIAAYEADRQAELAELLPQIFAGTRPVPAPASLFLPMSPSTGRHRPGTSPFLSPPACAERLVAILADGYAPDEGGSAWWERDLIPIVCADHPAALGTPIALRLAQADVRVTVFSGDDETTYRLFTPRLRAALSIVLAADATDEWWEAYEDSYHEFRDSLQRELRARGHPTAIIGAE
jgi:hypothetical protein